MMKTVLAAEWNILILKVDPWHIFSNVLKQHIPGRHFTLHTSQRDGFCHLQSVHEEVNVGLSTKATVGRKVADNKTILTMNLTFIKRKFSPLR